MKIVKTVVMGACAALALSFAACNSSSNKTEAPAEEQKPEAVEQPAASATSVVELSDDNQFRPGLEVPQITVLDFNAVWCIPCKKLTPAFDKAAEEYAGKVAFYSVDFEKNADTAKAFGIENVPVVVIMLPNGQTQRFDGLDSFISTDELKETASDAAKCTDIIYNNLVGLIAKAQQGE